jgi:serine protease DegQ
VTAGVGVLFLLTVFAPRLLSWTTEKRDVVTIREANSATVPAGTASSSYSAAAKKAIPSVVNVFTSKLLPSRRYPLLESPLGERLFGGSDEAAPQRATSLGSGVTVSDDGYILTNNHVVEGADEIAVVFYTGQQARARIVGADPETDLAILKVEAKNVRPITFGNADKIQVGDVVLAIGDPFGGTVSLPSTQPT